MRLSAMGLVVGFISGCAHTPAAPDAVGGQADARGTEEHNVVLSREQCPTCNERLKVEFQGGTDQHGQLVCSPIGVS